MIKTMKMALSLLQIYGPNALPSKDVLHEDQENGFVTFAFLRELNTYHEFSREENSTIYWIIKELFGLYLNREKTIEIKIQ